MAKQLFPYITPEMLSRFPDQTTDILNHLIDFANSYSDDYNHLQEEINRLQREIKAIPVYPEPEPTPPSPTPTPEEWRQYRQFNPANMGTQRGWCLKNCRLGFGITTGRYASAKDDMIAQKSNGTFHYETEPPSYIAVPVYIDTSSPYEHVVVWDHGVVYSDGQVIYDGLDHWAGHIYGWGEFCDGCRVVEHIS